MVQVDGVQARVQHVRDGRFSLGGAFIPGGFEKGAKAAAKVGGSVMGGASSALKGLTKNIDCASPNVINRTVGKALGKCFVAGTLVTVPTGGEGRGLVTGAGVMTAGIIACGIAHLPRKKREEEDREALFADPQLDKWDDALDNEWDAPDDHWGKDFVDLEQERLDALCDLLFHGQDENQVGRGPAIGALALGAGFPTSPLARPQVSPYSPVGRNKALRRSGTTPRAMPELRKALFRPTLLPSHCPSQTATQPKRPRPTRRQHGDNLRSWLGSATLLLCTVFAAFCFYKEASDDVVGCLPIEQIHPADKVVGQIKGVRTRFQ